jgi:hypothetical protein
MRTFNGIVHLHSYVLITLIQYSELRLTPDTAVVKCLGVECGQVGTTLMILTCIRDVFGSNRG